jgi:hypothetical protein
VPQNEDDYVGFSVFNTTITQRWKNYVSSTQNNFFLKHFQRTKIDIDCHVITKLKILNSQSTAAATQKHYLRHFFVVYISRGEVHVPWQKTLEQLSKSNRI